MSGQTGDPNDPWTGTCRPDPHGQAALLLVESLLHGLIARSLIRTEDAVEIVEIAAEVKVEIGLTESEPQEVAAASLRLLAAISTSLASDLPTDPATKPGPLA
jgi:hypothetical protein